MDVSVIMPIHNPNNIIMRQIRKTLKEQKINGKFEIIEVDKGWGLAKSIDYGIEKSKYNIIVTLHQDCIPEDKFWLKKLIEPLKDKKVIVSVSKVHLPSEMWDTFDIFAKSLTLKEKGTITPLMDGKGCAFRKPILKKVGSFNNEDFRTSGEDFDLYIRLKNLGKIAYPDCKVIHIHPTSLKNRLKKALQNANGYGALIRIHHGKMNGWKNGLIMATPIIGILAFLFTYPFRKSLMLFIPYLIISPLFHIYYIYGFWKGFLMGKQTI